VSHVTGTRQTDSLAVVNFVTPGSRRRDADGVMTAPAEADADRTAVMHGGAAPATTAAAVDRTRP
jgi:hypothetical protein